MDNARSERDMKKVLIKAVKEIGKFLLENFQMENASRIFRQKGDFDYSIKMDVEAGKKIIEMLKENGIQGTIFSEEAGKVKIGESEYSFFIDPLDGTINYSLVIPLFCTSIGITKNGKRIFWAVYYPFRNELFFSEKDKGSFLNNKKIHVNGKSEIRKSIVDFSFAFNNPQIGMKYMKKLALTQTRNLWCVALNLCYIACGRANSAMHIWSTSWDFMAGSLIVEETGGIVTDLRGNIWNEKSDSLIAANPTLHKKLLEIIGD